MADYSQLMNLEKQRQGQPVPSSVPQASITQSTNQLASKPASQPTTQSTSQSTHPSHSLPDEATVERPKSFYITVRLDKRLDEAVRYFQEVHGIKKVDRSILVNAMLDTDTQWTDEALDVLVERVMRLLTKKLMR